MSHNTSGMQYVFGTQSQSSMFPALPSSRHLASSGYQNNYHNPQTLWPDHGHQLQDVAYVQPPRSHGVPDSINEFNPGMSVGDMQSQRDTRTIGKGTTSQILSSTYQEFERLLGSQGVPEKENESSLQRKRNMVRQQTASSSMLTLQELRLRISNFSSTTPTRKVPNSQVLSSTDPAIANRTRMQPSEATPKILNMNSNQTSIRPRAGRARKPIDVGLINHMKTFQQVPLGRPPKRRHVGESFYNLFLLGESSKTRKFQKGYSGTREIGMNAKPQEAHKTPQSANHANPSPRGYLNAAYDPKYLKNGGFIDPLLRRFDSLTGRGLI